MITAICNIFINSDEKFSFFKENFSAVYNISDNWLVYFRGKFKQDAIEYVKTIDKENSCTIFTDLYDNDWARSVRDVMMKKSRHDYVYVFLEDHFLQRSLDFFCSVLKDMMQNKIDYFQYSFFNIGFSEQSTEYLYPDETEHFRIVGLESSQIPTLKYLNKAFYPYSLASVCSREYFTKILNIEKRVLIKVPAFIQILMENIIFFYPRNRAFWFYVNRIVRKINLRFIIYPSATPFNLEKSLFDCDEELLPLRVGILKEELFANWDDDNKLNGSSLVKRGLYPKKLRLDSGEQPDLSNVKKCFLQKGATTQYQYCPDIARIAKLPMKYIEVRKGSLKISTKEESFILSANQSVWIVASIPHTFHACDDCEYNLYLDSGFNEQII